MSFVGKVLVVVQVVLSVVFMAFAGAVYSVQTSWRTVANERQVALDEATQRMNDLTAEFELYKDTSTKSLTETQNRAEAAEVANQRLQEQVDLLNRQGATLNTEVVSQRDLAEIATDEATLRGDEANKQRVVNRSLHERYDKAINEVRDLNSKLFSQEVELNAIRAKHEQVLNDLRLVRRVLVENGLEADAAKIAQQMAPPPTVTGKVVETKKGSNNGTEFVEVSLGSDDGLAEGHKLFVYRLANQEGQRATYLGQTQIVYVTPARCGGPVAERAKHGVHQRGDDVSSKL